MKDIRLIIGYKLMTAHTNKKVYPLLWAPVVISLSIIISGLVSNLKTLISEFDTMSKMKLIALIISLSLFFVLILLVAAVTAMQYFAPKRLKNLLEQWQKPI